MCIDASIVCVDERISCRITSSYIELANQGFHQIKLANQGFHQEISVYQYLCRSCILASCVVIGFENPEWVYTCFCSNLKTLGIDTILQCGELAPQNL